MSPATLELEKAPSAETGAETEHTDVERREAGEHTAQRLLQKMQEAAEQEIAAMLDEFRRANGAGNSN